MFYVSMGELDVLFQFFWNFGVGGFDFGIVQDDGVVIFVEFGGVFYCGSIVVFFDCIEDFLNDFCGFGSVCC